LSREYHTGYYLIVIASIFIIFAGIKVAASIVVPFLLALFLTIILSPTYSFFNKKGLPHTLSLILVISLFLIIMGLVGKLISSSLVEFNTHIDLYTQKLQVYFHFIVEFALQLGFEINDTDIMSLIQPKQIMTFSSSLLYSLSGLFSDGFVVLFTLIFMLLESDHFIEKLKLFQKENTRFEHFVEISNKIKEYMVLKTLISLLTGFVIYIFLLIIGTDYAFLWAVIAFLFNFIPNIGSIIAAVPVVLLTLIQLGSFSALLALIMFVVVNIVVGSIIEPKVMGKGLGLSSLVVFLSLVFWGWLLGIVGMFLSIPLTIMLKIVLDNNRSTKHYGALLA
jgi:AI-2 transport protein TqsA